MDSKAFVELVEKELKAQKITKAAFYEATGISSASFSQWRKGMYSPSSANIKSIEEFLKISFHLSTKEKSSTPDGVEQIPGYEDLSEENKAKAKDFIAFLLSQQ